MRKVSKEVISAFLSGRSKTVGNTSTDGTTLFLHGNAIARRSEGGIEITHAGWQSSTTKERLNAIPGVSIQQKRYIWYLNGEEWDGKWKRI